MKPFVENFIPETNEIEMNTITHRELRKEYEFYNAVKEGDIDYVRKNCEDNEFGNPSGMGVLSKNRLLNIKYHFCITTALIARHCIEGGMEAEKALHLSDYYIGVLDSLSDVKSVIEWHDKMVMDYTAKMHMMKATTVASEAVQMALDYIYTHICDPITLCDISENVGLSYCYLSKLFAKETGVNLKDYILEMKIEKAKNLLKYTETDSVEIAHILSFSTQSHFISTFKRYTGTTPKKYKNHHVRECF